MIFDKELLEDIIKENILFDKPHIKLITDNGLQIKDSTPTNLKSIDIKINNFGTEVLIEMSHFFCDDLITRKTWEIKCIDYEHFNFALDYLINKK